MVKRTVEDIYTDYYLSQAGSGFSNIYSGPVYQKGNGIGSFLGGLYRVLFPLIKSGSAAAGKELLKTGVNIISDISRNQDPKDVIKRRGKESINNLGHMIGEKMFGAGYKQRSVPTKRQSRSSGGTIKKRKINNKVKTQTKKNQTKKNQTKKRPTKIIKASKQKSIPRKRCKSEILDIFS